MQQGTEEPKCPDCGSTNWRCWDERIEWFEDEYGEPFEEPVGYLACRDCGAAFCHAWTTAKYLGADEAEAFGIDDPYHL